YELAVFSNSLLGWGTALFIIFSLLVFAIFFFNITSFTSVRAPADSAEDVEEDVDVKISALQNAKFLADTKNSEDDLMPEEDLDSNPTNEDESELEQWVVSKKEDEVSKKESGLSALTLQINHEEIPHKEEFEDT